MPKEDGDFCGEDWRAERICPEANRILVILEYGHLDNHPGREINFGPNYETGLWNWRVVRLHDAGGFTYFSKCTPNQTSAKIPRKLRERG